MYHSGLSKEFPKIPFVRDDNNNEHSVIFQKTIPFKDFNIFIKHVGLKKYFPNLDENNIIFNVIVQSLAKKNETNLCFHTLILRNLSQNMHTIPNNENINIKSTIKYVLINLENNSDYDTNQNLNYDLNFKQTDINISNSESSIVGFYPLKSCKFNLTNEDKKFYSLLSLVNNGVIEILSNGQKKNITKSEFTLHILVDAKISNIKMSCVFEFIQNEFKLII